MFRNINEREESESLSLYLFCYVLHSSAFFPISFYLTWRGCFISLLVSFMFIIKFSIDVKLKFVFILIQDLTVFADLMQECWHANATFRTTSRKVEEKIGPVMGCLKYEETKYYKSLPVGL